MSCEDGSVKELLEYIVTLEKFVYYSHGYSNLNKLIEYLAPKWLFVIEDYRNRNWRRTEW